MSYSSCVEIHNKFLFTRVFCGEVHHSGAHAEGLEYRPTHGGSHVGPPP